MTQTIKHLTTKFVEGGEGGTYISSLFSNNTDNGYKVDLYLTNTTGANQFIQITITDTVVSEINRGTFSTIPLNNWIWNKSLTTGEQYTLKEVLVPAGYSIVAYADNSGVILSNAYGIEYPA